MKVKLIIISIVLLLVMVFACGCIPIMEKIGLINPTNEEQLSPEKGGPPDGLVKVLIEFKEKPGPPEQALVKGLGGKIKYTYNLIPAIAASVPEVAIEALKKNPNITNVELDSKVYALDTELDNSWGVKRIGAGFVHESGNKGGGVKVAIIDSGIDYTHSDLNANYIDGYDFVNGDDAPMDDYGHGTHVAGIIAAGDNGFGVVGVAPEASLYALKVLDSNGSGYVSDVVMAIQWATDPNGDGSADDRLDIINMSLGGGASLTLEVACLLAYYDGLILVAAAGNGGSVIYPAAYSSVIAVSATDINDELAWFSSTGFEVELAAPGVNINSTLPGNNYSGETWSGTSMASPHVAGTAVLVWTANPGWSNDAVRAQLQNTAEDIGLSTREQGYGLVDAAEAVGVDTDTTPPAKVTGLTVTTVSYAQLDLAWDANAEGDLDNYNVYRSTTSGGSYDLVSSPTTNSYSDVGLTTSTTYYYIVSAVDVSGNEGEASDEASGTTSADDLLGPVTSNVVAEPSPTNGATLVTLTADVSDVTTGNSNIAEAEYFVDSVGADGSGTTMSASDGAFNSPVEGVTASIDISGWLIDKYTLFVHGKDVEGNWGDIKSVLLDVTEAPSNIIYVKSIDFSAVKVRKKLTLYTKVKVSLEDNTTVEGATVSMNLTYRRRSWDFTGDTNSDGIVKFTLSNAKTGNYTATVTDVSHTDYEWVNGETEKSCNLDKDGNTS